MDLTFIAGLVAGGVAVYIAIRTRIHQIRSLVDLVDEALVDDKVTEEEFRAIWAAAKGVIKGGP